MDHIREYGREWAKNLTYVHDLRVCRFGACIGLYGMDCDGRIYLYFRINIERGLALFKVYLRMPEPELQKFQRSMNLESSSTSGVRNVDRFE
jgi:hypothetical protein